MRGSRRYCDECGKGYGWASVQAGTGCSTDVQQTQHSTGQLVVGGAPCAHWRFGGGRWEEWLLIHVIRLHTACEFCVSGRVEAGLSAISKAKGPFTTKRKEKNNQIKSTAGCEAVNESILGSSVVVFCFLYFFFFFPPGERLKGIPQCHLPNTKQAWEWEIRRRGAKKEAATLRNCFQRCQGPNLKRAMGDGWVVVPGPGWLDRARQRRKRGSDWGQMATQRAPKKKHPSCSLDWERHPKGVFVLQPSRRQVAQLG